MVEQRDLKFKEENFQGAVKLLTFGRCSYYIITIYNMKYSQNQCKPSEMDSVLKMLTSEIL